MFQTTPGLVQAHSRKSPPDAVGHRALDTALLYHGRKRTNQMSFAMQIFFQTLSSSCGNLLSFSGYRIRLVLLNYIPLTCQASYKYLTIIDVFSYVWSIKRITCQGWMLIETSRQDDGSFDRWLARMASFSRKSNRHWHDRRVKL